MGARPICKRINYLCSPNTQNMRKILLLLSALSLFFACKTEEPENTSKPNTTNENYLKEFRATLSNMELKSIALPSNGKVSWEKGDQVLVDNGTDVAIFTYNSSRGVFVTERNDFELAEAYTAVFPAAAFLEESEKGNPMISISAEQKIYSNYIKDLAMVVKGKVDFPQIGF